jgi:phage shock protein B
MYSLIALILFCVIIAPLLFILCIVWMATQGRRHRLKHDIPASALEDLKKKADQYQKRIDVLESLLLEKYDGNEGSSS